MSSLNIIYHEKQESLLCGVHCLNNLLQGPYFSEITLAEIAQELDDIECALLEREIDRGKSKNVSDEGNYSIQVLSKALESLDLSIELVKKNNQNGTSRNYKGSKGFVCNYGNHWIPIRKIENTWWNLDSKNKKPLKLSETYLEIYLEQLVVSGYSIFSVVGVYPNVFAEQEGPNWTFVTSYDDIEEEVEEDEEDLDLAIALELSKSEK